MLVLMSDVDGVYTGPPGLEGSRLIHTFNPMNNSVRYGAMSRVGSGGMQSKVSASRECAFASCVCVLTMT